MDNNSKVKVVIDSDVDKSIPTVLIATPPIPEEQLPVEPTSEKPPVSFLNRITKQIINFFMDFLETIVVSLSIFVVVYLFLIQPHEVKGSSMEPNFQNNEYILTDKISYRFNNPKRGEVVIFKAPNNPDVDYIKRIIGLPGDKVKVEKSYVYLNNQKLNEYYLKDLTALFPGSFMIEGINITVEDGKYFVMGDNRSHSSDSREFGLIEKSSIIGKAVLKYWPIPEFGLVPVINY